MSDYKAEAKASQHTKRAKYAGGGTVMRPLGNGQVQVINPSTGQVLYTGSASGAANSQANNGGMKKVID